jgi:hypothetical protein
VATIPGAVHLPADLVDVAHLGAVGVEVDGVGATFGVVPLAAAAEGRSIGIVAEFN